MVSVILPILASKRSIQNPLPLLPGLRGIYDADFGVFNDLNKTMPCTNNQTVANWADRSGDNCDLVQQTAGSRPTFKTNQINGNSALAFSGSNQFFFMTCALSLPSYTFYTVVSQTGTGASGLIGSAGGGLYWSGDTKINHLHLTATPITDIGSGTAAQVTGSFIQANASWDDAAGAAIFRQSSIADGSASAAVHASNPLFLVAATTNIVLTGSMAFMAVYAVVHTTAQRQLMEAYLKARYGV